MRTLWIEDLPTESLAIALFKDLLQSDDFENYDHEKQDGLSQFFKENSIYDISICRGYSEFIQKYEKNYLSYDIFIIDLDLSSEASETLAIPKEFENKKDFLEKAGFYIWSLLIRKGIPEDNIAFMTGNGDNINLFKKHCIESFIPPLKDENVFIKEEDNDDKTKIKRGYSKFRVWLDRTANTTYIQLRRGILDGCKQLKEFIETEKDNEKCILLNVCTKKDFETKLPEVTLKKEYAIDFLFRIENYFIKHFSIGIDIEGKENFRNQLLYSFLMLISMEWERAHIPKNSTINYYDDYEEEERRFCKSSLWIMKNLRNMQSHFNFDKTISEIDIAFIFILGMRNFFALSINRIYPYEKLLLDLCKTKKGEFVNFIDNNKAKEIPEYMSRLCDSYEVYPEKEKQKDLRNEDLFFQMTTDFIESAKIGTKKERKTAKTTKDEVVKRSKKLLYNAYLVGLFHELKKEIQADTLVYELGALALEAVSKD